MSVIGTLVAPLTGPRLSSADRHVIWLPRARLAYFRVPKAANSSIRYLLAQRFGLDRSTDLRPNKDRFWSSQRRTVARTLDPGAFLANPRARLAWSFSFVRHPAARLYSCWNNKVIENGHLSARLVAMGAYPGMEFDRFAELAAACDDDRCDIHLRSQSAILASGGRLLPDFIGRVETLPEDWAHVAYEVRMRCGVELGPLPEKNVRARTAPSVTSGIGAATRALILRRYRRDFDLFYPEAIAAMQAPDQPAGRAQDAPDSKESHRCEGSTGR